MQPHFKNALSMAMALAFLILPKVTFASKYNEELLNHYIQQQYNNLEGNGFDLPPFDLFERGLIGYLDLKYDDRPVTKDIITLIDFRLSSIQRRLWIVDLAQHKIMFHTVVSHGKNTGDEFAKYFSNTPNSNKSSVGFYLTAETYYGKHGLSLRLDGQEPGFNDNARKRAVVMHGATYATRDFAKVYGRLGRSFGCPAVPMKYHKEIIKVVANRSLLFIYYPLKEYESSTTLNDRMKAANYLIKQGIKAA